jgi:glucose/arabinose dehydrogenase
MTRCAKLTTTTATLIFAVAVASSSLAVSPIAPELELELVADGFDDPVIMTHTRDGSGRLFIGEQGGVVWIWTGTQILPVPFLDISSLTNGGGERGLLGLAFHPDYPNDDRFFVNYTNNSGDTVIAQYRVSGANPNVADPGSAFILLTVDQPYSNHNGGSIAFSPIDGYLYIGLGDGGSGGDPLNSGQLLNSLLGKILRINVDGALPYEVPPDNPFVGAPGEDEIWAWGIRNPWRFSFDRETGDFFIGDVGQGSWEEIDFQPAASSGGENYGWRCWEGNHPFNQTGCGDPDDYVFPILEYSHGFGCSVTGGYRYRGALYPNLYGYYLYADYCTGTVWGAVNEEGTWTSTALLPSLMSVSSFGEDELGELYLADHSSFNGAVYRIIDISPTNEVFSDGFESGDTSAWSGS